MIYSVKHYGYLQDDEPMEYFVESEFYPSPQLALKILRDNGTKVNFDEEKGHGITVHSLDVKKALPPTKKYEHLYSIGFSVQTDGEEATVEEMWEGLNKRVADLEKNYGKEIFEAAGLPDDITEN